MKPDARNTAVEARIDAAVASLVQELDARLGEDPSELKVDDLLAELATEIDGDLQPIVESVLGVVAAYNTPPRSRASATLGRMRFADVFEAADALAVDAGHAADLTAAREAVASAEADYQQHLTGLDKAVAVGDVDEVLRLRSEVEVTLPRRRDEARLALMDLNIARATRISARCATRREASVSEVEAATSDRDRAAEALKQAAVFLDAVYGRHSVADQVATRSARSVAEMTAERDALSASAAATSEQRLRRLAGLEVKEHAAALTGSRA